MHPQMTMNIAAVLVATVASFGFGWLWHGPLFGRLWLRLMGYSSNMKPDAKGMATSFALGILATLLTAYVMFYWIEVWHPSVWGVGADEPFYFYGFFGGLYAWLGFAVTFHLHSVAWEKRSWKMFALDVVYRFIDFQIIAMIIAWWR